MSEEIANAAAAAGDGVAPIAPSPSQATPDSPLPKLGEGETAAPPPPIEPAVAISDGLLHPAPLFSDEPRHGNGLTGPENNGAGQDTVQARHEAAQADGFIGRTPDQSENFAHTVAGVTRAGIVNPGPATSVPVAEDALAAERAAKANG